MEQTEELIEAADAIGVRCIVIDENTDWSKMPSLFQLMGFKDHDDYLEHHERQKRESLEKLRQDVRSVMEGVYDDDDC